MTMLLDYPPHAHVPVDDRRTAARDRGAQDLTLVRKAHLHLPDQAGNAAILLSCANELPWAGASARRRRHAPEDANGLPCGLPFHRATESINDVRDYRFEQRERNRYNRADGKREYRSEKDEHRHGKHGPVRARRRQYDAPHRRDNQRRQNE